MSLKKIFNILQKFAFQTVGGIATSSLLICAFSGIFLAVPYHVKESFDSISLMLLDNPAAAYIRDIHYWSAQFFLVFSILHMVDHFLQKTENNLSAGVWFRLTISVPAMLFVMISGFILKGDEDAFSAFSILASLTEKIPLAGGLLKVMFLGNENSLELIYVHHIATGTIFIFIVIHEHSRKLWPVPVGFVLLLFIILLLSFFLHAPAGGATGKGPWYFVGLQEILHWISRPGWAWFILLFPFVIIWLIPRMHSKGNLKLKYVLLVLLAIYSMATITGLFFRGENWRWVTPWDEGKKTLHGVAYYPLHGKTAENFGFEQQIPKINGQREGCLVCHDNVIGFEESHQPEALGCSSCHGGNPLSLEKNVAHKRMDLIPGNLSNAEKRCGTTNCHPDIFRRVSNSIMTTMSGVISVDRFVFGENDSPDTPAHVKNIGHSAADQHLRDLCANCHLGNPKNETGPVTQLTRGGGCNACHLNYSDSALVSLTLADARLNSGIYFHPQLNIKMSDDHCFGCHSRSGRISLSYGGWHETLYAEGNIPAEGRFRIIEDKRILEYIGEDIHHKAGMLCIDCHLSVELMGDAHHYAHKELQTKLRCGDCHLDGKPELIAYPNLDAESKKIVALRKWSAPEHGYLIGPESGLPLINALINDQGQFLLRTKSGDSMLMMNAPALICSRGKAHQSLSCESCHASWVPQCIGCHNTYDKDAAGYDMLENRLKKGSWVEHVGMFMSGKPTLGIVQESDGSKKVMTFTPGMVLSIDTSSFHQGKPGEKNIFRRLYAPASAHTTVREGRSCKSCHMDPLAIGYGRGELIYEIKGHQGKWIFRNRFALNEYDHLPEDAWIGFLSDPAAINSTRTNTRPFSLEEQKSILTVGACLVCHPEDSKLMEETLVDFHGVLENLSGKCILPEWK